MKKLIALAMALLMISASALVVFAAPTGKNVGEVPMYKGEIKIDGEMEEIYKQGMKVVMDEQKTAGKGTATGTAYYLWNDKYIYVYVDITDPDFTDKLVDESKNYKNEGAEISFDVKNDGVNRNKWTLWNKGQAGPSGDAKEEWLKVAYKKTAKGFAYEVCFDMVAAGGTGKAGAQIGYNALINDVIEGTTRTIVRVKTSLGATENEVAKYDYFTLGSKEVKVAVAETKPTSPATFDAGVIIAAVAAVSCAGAVVVSKKRK